MKFKVGDTIYSDIYSECVKIVMVGKDFYKVRQSGMTYSFSHSYVDCNFSLDEVEDEAEDKSTWTYKQWFDAGFVLHYANGDTAGKREDGRYFDECRREGHLAPWSESWLSRTPPPNLIKRMIREQETTKSTDPLPCSCSSRDLLICGCKCGGI